MRKKLAVYFTFPFPDYATIRQFLASINSELVDYVELGIPVKNPYYDGPKIRTTHGSSIEHFKPDEMRNEIKELQNKGLKTYTLTYLNSIEKDQETGIKNLKDSGFEGVIFPDLLIDYYDTREDTLRIMDQENLSLIPFFTSSTPDGVVHEMLERTSSWVYHGIQPSTGVNVPVDTEKTGERIRRISGSREIIFGFGISNTEDARRVMESGADGIAIGSMFIDYLKRGDVEGFKKVLKELRGVMDEF